MTDSTRDTLLGEKSPQLLNDALAQSKPHFPTQLTSQDIAVMNCDPFPTSCAQLRLPRTNSFLLRAHAD